MKLTGLQIIASGVILLLAGCISQGISPRELTSNNYLSKIEVRKSDKDFYLGEYVGSLQGCFPPIDRPICAPLAANKEEFKATRRLDIVEFTISASTREVSLSEKKKDFMFLVAADLSLQQGYPYFTVTTEYGANSCSSSYTAYTNGALTGGNYSGSTRLVKRNTCFDSSSIKVLLFREKKELSEGVLFRRDRDSHLGLQAESSLYYGTTPGVRQSGLDSYQRGSRSYVPVNAWKVHYDAAGLSDALRTKYAIKRKPPISFIDERLTNASRPRSPIDTNRHVHH